MSDFTTAARPYARAAFETAQGDASQAQWSDMLAMLAEVVAHPDTQLLLDSPQLGAADKASTIIEICGKSLDQQGQNLVRLLAENGRMHLVAEVHTLYEVMLAEAQRKIEAVALSAFPIGKAQEAAIVAALKKKLGCDVTLQTKLDKTLVGGVVIRAGDLVIDGSTKARLAALTQTLGQ